MIGAQIGEDRLTLYGSFTSSSSYKPMLYLALAGLPFSFRTVNLKTGVQNSPEYLARVRHSARFRKMHDEVIAEFRPRAEAALSFVDKTVTDRPFLLGDACTVADIGCWGRMVFMAEGGFEIGNWPHLEAWAGRLKAMPGFALPYDLIPSKDREFPAAPHYRSS